MYNYLEAVKNDVRFAINEGYVYIDYDNDIDDIISSVEDILWADDAVTGNESGSYTGDKEEAKGYVSENLDLLADAIDAFDNKEEAGKNLVYKNWEWFDVIMRLYVLNQAVEEVVNEMLVA